MFNGLKTVTNQIAWLELPLLPWKTQYGEIQRKLAEEMKITLIPKRILSDVFQSPGTTSDSIHLTAKGHQVMAEKVSRLFESKTKYRKGLK
jgi:lysophospholipase L1-like esterase